MAKPTLPNWYSWVVLFAFTLGSIGISIVVNINLAERAIAADHKARADAAAQSKSVVCLVVTTQENVFSQSTTDVGVKAAKAWHDLGILFRCY